MESKGRISKVLVNILNVLIALSVLKIASSLGMLLYTGASSPVWIAAVLELIFLGIIIYALFVMVIKNKDINGVWLYIGVRLGGTALLYFMFGKELEMSVANFLVAFLSVVLLCLLLLIRRDGKSAWQVLLNNKKDIKLE